jgi:hypothetical protein
MEWSVWNDIVMQRECCSQPLYEQEFDLIDVKAEGLKVQ